MSDPYAHDDYKATLKARLKELKERRPGLTWKRIAAEAPMQHTYLSKALNDPSVHLNEDHLFAIGRALEFFPEEIEFMADQRALALAQDPDRKRRLLGRIREARRARDLSAANQRLDSGTLNDQTRYLFEPLCSIIHVALTIPRIRRDPRSLCGPLGLSVERLKDLLRCLSRCDYIDLEEDGLSVKAVKQPKIHFGPDHFLMRFSLAMARSQVAARIAQTPEDSKFSFLVTMTLDEASYAKLRDEFRAFLKKAERIAENAREEGVYQMSFDLFKWM